jgi:CRISPR/Cas system CMR subunit Cmr4 (Cas7 group RAMP superfamily)
MDLISTWWWASMWPRSDIMPSWLQPPPKRWLKKLVFENDIDCFCKLLQPSKAARVQKDLAKMVFGLEPTGNYHEPLSGGYFFIYAIIIFFYVTRGSIYFFFFTIDYLTVWLKKSFNPLIYYILRASADWTEVGRYVVI